MLRGIVCLFLIIINLEAYVKPPSVTQDVWHETSPYFLKDPLKSRLDQIFAKCSFRVIQNEFTLREAGFEILMDIHCSGIVVAKHSKLKGYLLKIFTDDYDGNKIDWLHFIGRIRGSESAQKAIDHRNVQKSFKAPKKWLYPLPYEPSPKSGSRKNYILVVEDMKILSKKANRKAYKSKRVTKDFLYEFYHVIEDAGLVDSVIADNVPFCEDGRIAFIDTEVYHAWPINYNRLTHYFTPACQAYWVYLFRTGGQK